MKKYQLIKSRNNDGKTFYAIANKEDTQDFKNTHFLPYEKAMKYKKYLIELINKDEKYKNNVDLKTYFIN